MFNINRRIERLQALQNGLRAEAATVSTKAKALSADQQRWYVVALNSAAKYLEEAQQVLERVQQNAAGKVQDQ